MLQITVGDEEVIDLLKDYVEIGNDYRKLSYSYEYRIEDGWLILNGLTQMLIFISEDEYNSFFGSQFAKEYFFVVPVEFDEHNSVKVLRERINKEIYKSKSIPTKYTIFTTTACNARCEYCFEKGTKVETMSVEMCEKVVECIIRHSSKATEKLNMHWFGGEPLLNTKVIDIICGMLDEKKVDYHSTITSNGYLLNEAMIASAVNKWKLDIIQITLDGTKDVYNRIKNYTDGVENAYEKVICNIKECIKAGLSVEIRLNVSENNGQNLIELVNELDKTIGWHENFNIYCCPLMERDDHGECRRKAKDNETLEKYELQLQKRIYELGYYKDRLRPTLWTRRCSAERESEITILPDGRVGICALYLNDNIMGDIDSEVFDQTVIDSFKIHFDELSECKECRLYPQCFRLKKCKFDTAWCPIENREVAWEVLHEQMEYEYKLYIKEKESEL